MCIISHSSHLIPHMAGIPTPPTPLATQNPPEQQVAQGSQVTWHEHFYDVGLMLKDPVILWVGSNCSIYYCTIYLLCRWRTLSTGDQFTLSPKGATFFPLPSQLRVSLMPKRGGRMSTLSSSLQQLHVQTLMYSYGPK